MSQELNGNADKIQEKSIGENVKESRCFKKSSCIDRRPKEIFVEIPGVYFRKSTQRWIAGWHFKGLRYWKCFSPIEYPDAKERAIAMRHDVERIKRKYEQEKSLDEEELFILTNGNLDVM